MIKISLAFAAAIVGCSMFFFLLGEKMKQEEIKQRCLEFKTTTYSQSQMDYIIFGEPQT